MGEKHDSAMRNLIDKVEAFIQKGVKLSQHLDIKERNQIIKGVMDDIISDCLENMKKNRTEDISQDELTEIEKELRQIVNKYYEQRIKELWKD